MGVLVLVTAALTCLAIYAINKNNKISELKAPRIVVSSDTGYLILQVTDEDCRFIEENYKEENGRYSIKFANSKGEVFIIISSGQLIYDKNTTPILLGSIKLFNTIGLEKKNGDGEFKKVNNEHQLETLGLGTEENDAKELVIRFVPSSIVKAPETEQEKNGRNK